MDKVKKVRNESFEEPDDNEDCYDYDLEDRSTGNCAFCGNRTYDGDILCPDCANNVD